MSILYYFFTFVACIYSVVWLTTVSMPLICVSRMYTIRFLFSVPMQRSRKHYDHCLFSLFKWVDIYMKKSEVLAGYQLKVIRGRNSGATVVVMFCPISVFSMSNVTNYEKKNTLFGPWQRSVMKYLNFQQYPVLGLKPKTTSWLLLLVLCGFCDMN